MEASAAQVSRLGDSLESNGLTDVVFLAVSSSSLAAELVTRGARFHVLSLTEPSGLRALEKKLDPRRTVFLVASKGGKNLELHTVLLYLLARAKAAGLSLNLLPAPGICIYWDSVIKEGRGAASL